MSTVETEEAKTSDSKSSQRSTLLPIFLLIASLAVFDLFAFSSPLAFNWFLNLSVDVLVAQGCLIVTIAGLYSRRWLDGLLYATCLAAFTICIFIAGRYLRLYVVLGLEAEGLWAAFLAPFILLAAATPLYAMRFFWGTHLTRHSLDPPRHAYSLEDFLSVMAVLGSCLFLIQVPRLAWELPREADFWAILVTISVIFAVLSFVVIAPTVYTFFRVERRSRRLLVYFAVSAVVVVLSVATGGFVVSPGIRGGLLAKAVIPANTAYGVFLAGLYALKKSGFRLRQFAQAEAPSNVSEDSVQETSDDPFDERESETTPSRPANTSRPADSPRPADSQQDRWASRWKVAGLLIAAAIGSVCVSQIDNQRRRQVLANQQLGQELLADGVEVQFDGREAAVLKLGPTTTDSDLARFTQFENLYSLDLSGSKITDEAAAYITQFESLRALNLADTSISATMLEALLQLEIQHLNLSGTELSVKSVNEYLKQKSGRLHKIDLSNMGWTFEELKGLLFDELQDIALRDYDLTDDQLIEILQIYEAMGIELQGLDVRNNQLTGSFLPAFTTAANPWGTSLQIDDNPITDPAFSRAMSVGSIRLSYLSISNTQLTDSCLTALAGVGVDELVLGDGQITEAGLAKGDVLPRTIRVHSKQFNGSFLKDWVGNPYPTVDLSYSGVTDDSLADSILTVPIEGLDLSHTSITDASLSTIGKASFRGTINLSHTQVTAAGLLRGELRGYPRVIVAHGQFTEDEIEAICKVINLEVGTVPVPTEDGQLP